MALQYGALTGRRRQPGYLSAINAQRGLMPALIQARLQKRREDERFQAGQEQFEKGYALDKKRLKQEADIAKQQRALSEKEFDYQKLQDMRERGLAIGGTALEFAKGTMDSTDLPDKLQGGIKWASKKFGLNTGSPIKSDPSGAMKYPGTVNKGIWNKLKGGLTTGNTLGAGLAGLGVGSMFGDSGAMKKGLLGAGAGMAMNLLKPGKFNLSGLLTSGFSGGLGALGSGLF